MDWYGIEKEKTNSVYASYMAHYGIKGQKWGERRFQNEDGSLTEAGKTRYYDNDRVFVSGSSKTQDKESPYYRKELPDDIKKELDSAMKAKSKVLVGDAPGIDTQVQEYLNNKKYRNVTVYTGDKEARSNIGKWDVKKDSGNYEPGTPEARAEKDKAMEKDSTIGLAVVLENGGASKTRDNVDRLIKNNKSVKVVELSADKKDKVYDAILSISTLADLLYYISLLKS